MQKPSADILPAAALADTPVGVRLGKAGLPESPMPVLDETRVDEDAYKHQFLADGVAYKGMQRGRLTGAIDGLGLGAIFGGLLCSALHLGGAALLGISATAVIASPFVIIPAMAAAAAIAFANGYGETGAGAAARSGSLAQKWARQIVKNPLYPNGNEPNLEGRFGHHYEIPPDRDRGVFFHWKTGLIGAGVAGTVGALIGESTAALGTAHSIVLAPSVFGATAGAAALGTIAAGPVLVGAALLGLYGLSYGINRSLFRSAQNWTDGLLHGKLTGTYSKSDYEPPKTREEQIQYQVDLRRQDIQHEMEPQLFRKLFREGIKGKFAGFASGPVIGLLTGAVVGLAAAALIPGAGLLAPVLMGCTAIGAAYGMETFSKTTSEAHMEATYRSLDEEFQRTHAQQEKGITPTLMPAREKDNKGLINFKTLAICAVGGGLVGLAAAPLFGAFLAAAAGIELGSAAFAVSGLAGAFIGSTYGVSEKIWRGVEDFSTGLYDGKILGEKGTEYAYLRHATTIDAPAQDKSISPVTLDDMRRLSAATLARAAMPHTQRLQPVPEAAGMGR
jgi:hypothetical protein